MSTTTPTTTITAAPTAASVVDLVKVYGEKDAAVVALDHVNAQFAQGTFTAIMGPSGSGKSTLMHCLAGLDRATSGRVLLGGVDLGAQTDRKLTALRRDAIGFVFQAFNLLPTLNARQNILLPLDLAGRRVDRDRFDAIVASLELGGRLTHLPSQLSGGQQQRVAVARALITSPQVIFADEPTGALDSRSSHQLLAYLRRCTDELGQTIVMVTHDPRAASFTDRALILSDGHIVDDLDSPTPDAAVAAIAATAKLA